MTTPLYRTLTCLLVPAAVGYTLWRAVRGGGRRYWRQRLGRDLPRGPFDYWLHCASVGEVRAAAPLARSLSTAGGRVLVTTATPTGADAAMSALPTDGVHAYLPLDRPGWVGPFLDRARPACGLIVETELWPFLFAACECRGIRLVIVNGRLSDRTLKAPEWLRRAYGVVLRSVAACLARSETDAGYFRALGMPAERVRVLGNLKYAQGTELPPSADMAPALAFPYLLAGSTREGEEAILVRVWKRIAPAGWKLVLAPRHPQRRESILKAIAPETERVAVRSRGDAVTADTEVYLADTLGELAGFMHHAQLVFLGGSLVPKGGHNVLEPAALGKPVVVGPSMANFAEEAGQLVASGGAVQVADEEELATTLEWLQANPDARARMGAAGREVVTSRASVLALYEEAVAAICDRADGDQSDQSSYP